MSEGFFLLHRGWRENPIFKGEHSRGDAWIWLIENACWKPSRVRIKGETVTLERGELSFSIRFLADAWGWSKSRVDRFLADLREEGMIETRSKIGTGDDQKSGQGQSIISICNYCKYQDQDDASWDNSGTQRGTTAGQQRDKEEQGNKGTIIEEPNGSSPHSPPKPKSTKSEKPKKVPMTADWQPSTFSPDVADLVAQWPPGRLDREIIEFREYWIEDGEKRPGWDRTFGSRIRNIHDRVMKEAKNGNRGQSNWGGSSGSHGQVDRRSGDDKAFDRRMGYDQSGYPSGETGRYDAGEGRSDGYLPLESPSSLP